MEVAAGAAGAAVTIGAADLAGAPGAPVAGTILQLSHDNHHE